MCVHFSFASSSPPVHLHPDTFHLIVIKFQPKTAVKQLYTQLCALTVSSYGTFFNWNVKFATIGQKQTRVTAEILRRLYTFHPLISIFNDHSGLFFTPALGSDLTSTQTTSVSILQMAGYLVACTVCSVLHFASARNFTFGSVCGTVQLQPTPGFTDVFLWTITYLLHAAESFLRS